MVAFSPLLRHPCYAITPMNAPREELFSAWQFIQHKFRIFLVLVHLLFLVPKNIPNSLVSICTNRKLIYRETHAP